VHNAAKARIPVLIFAGSSPFTQDGEMLGSRNEFIQWIQDVHDQRGLVRGYMRMTTKSAPAQTSSNWFIARCNLPGLTQRDPSI
jgi:hypothetical protein